jgi:hypothetical protein
MRRMAAEQITDLVAVDAKLKAIRKNFVPRSPRAART